MKRAELSFFLFLVSCGYGGTGLQSTGDAGLGGGKSGQPAKLDFATIRAQVFQPYCFGCHSAAKGNQGGVNLETYTSVWPLAQTIFDEVSTGAMPKVGTLPESTKSFLFMWIERGAPEFALARDARIPLANGVIFDPTEGTLRDSSNRNQPLGLLEKEDL